MMKLWRIALLQHSFVDLRANAVHQHQPDAQTFQQGEIVDQVIELRLGNSGTAEKNYKGAVAVRVDIGRGVSEPVDEGGGLLHEVSMLNRLVAPLIMLDSWLLKVQSRRRR